MQADVFTCIHAITFAMWSGARNKREERQSAAWESCSSSQCNAMSQNPEEDEHSKCKPALQVLLWIQFCPDRRIRHILFNSMLA